MSPGETENARLSRLLKGAQQLMPEELTQLRRELETLAHIALNPEQAPKKSRTPGLNRGHIWTSDDFNDPLPEEYLGME